MASSGFPAIESSSFPLADYFFIAGIDSASIFDTTRAQSNGDSAASTLKTTIEETALSANDGESRASLSVEFRDSFDSTPKNKNRFSYDNRRSVASFIQGEPKPPASNRSSATIKPSQDNHTTAASDSYDSNFDDALRSFASERDSFLESIQFSAGQIAQPPKLRPKVKPQRMGKDEQWGDRTSMGGLRRRISTMKPLSRSSTIRDSRRSSVRNSKRMSGYNAVIPAPQRFKFDSTMHPLKRPFEPCLLDKYPKKDADDDTKQRCAFPDYVPMFVFPNDVHVVSADERPRSTWHGFTMTGGDSSKIYGICLTIWIPLQNDAAVELERQCEHWRRENMSSEERELANSLGERLADERARLSRLLSELPNFHFGTQEREAKEEELAAVEERIHLMTDMLRPVRHGASSKIEGLTQSETGFWIPRAYGILGRDASMTSFWKEWLRAVALPMANGNISRVPPSSPSIGAWQPLERYVVNLCMEAISPISSITQVEVSIRDLRLYARKDAENEIPGSRNVDLYPLFRCLNIPEIVMLFEYVLAESRIIFLSSHTAMLHLACAAITQLLYPFKWSGVLIPVLPARLIQALEAPCPYIIGIERRYENVELPDDDFVLVDLDQGFIEATKSPISLPRQHRRKLQSLLQVAAPHHNRYGVPIGPPKYATEAYPFNSFATENEGVFEYRVRPSTLSYLAGLNSASFGYSASTPLATPLYNPFHSTRVVGSGGHDRPSTSSTAYTSAPPSPSVTSSSFGAPAPSIPTMTPASRTNSGHALQASLREKRSGLFEGPAKRTSSFGTNPRRPSLPMSSHLSSASVSTMSTKSSYPMSNYAPSVYAQSTIAASTVMPTMLVQPVRNTESTKWIEAHCLQWKEGESNAVCSICNEKNDGGMYKCSGCITMVHANCADEVSLVCPSAFHHDQIIAAFVRCFASLLYTYRKYMKPSSAEAKRKKIKKTYEFDMDHFVKSVSSDHADYLAFLRDTQGLNEFIYERETKKPQDPEVRLFDEIILAKRNRGKPSFLSKFQTDFLSDSSDHLWRTAATAAPSTRTAGANGHIIGRTPAKLDPSLMKDSRLPKSNARRKPVPSLLDASALSLSD